MADNLKISVSETLIFLRSVIQSGGAWTQECQDAYDAAQAVVAVRASDGGAEKILADAIVRRFPAMLAQYSQFVVARFVLETLKAIPGGIEYLEGPPMVSVGMRITRSNFDKVGEFYRKHGFPTCYARPPQIVDDETFDFRIGFIREETDELGEAHVEKDLVKVADAIGDLLYVGYGAAHFYAIPMDEVFDAIHRANMRKVQAPTARSEKFDVVKPPGWVPPEEEISKILEAHRGSD